MRLQIASDLHHQFSGAGLATSRLLPISKEADMLILAGNIHLSDAAINMYRDCGLPVVFVNGCIELHGADIGAARKVLFARTAGTSMRYLERTAFEQDHARFLGCCLWTDYCLGSRRPERVISAANRCSIYHRLIRYGRKSFGAEHAAKEHASSRAWLARQLAKTFDGATVVVTHHAPSIKSIPLALRNREECAALASELDDLVAKADVWIHGLIPDTLDYTIGRARVICNARGLPWESYAARRRFEPEFVIKL